MNEDFPEDLAIRVRNVGKTYRLGAINRHTLHEEIAGRLGRLRGRRPAEGPAGEAGTDPSGLFRALDDVSFDVRKGETVGLIGRNGAGKSTMLKLLARITTPTTGEAWIRGRLGALLEVGTGFHPELTGRENIVLNGTILGMSKREIDAKFDEIVDFSEIGDFLDTPVKRYSSGMYVKLAFAVASSLDTDVLLLDEVLAVGDAAFRRKSLARMKKIAESGRTILFVSHAIANIRDICTRCLWFDHGRIVQDGPTEEVADAYERCHEDTERTLTFADLMSVERKTKASGYVRFASIRLLDENGEEREPLCGRPLTVRLELDVAEDLPSAHLSLGVRSASGRPTLSFPSLLTRERFPLAAGRHVAELHVPKLPLTEGSYAVALYASAFGGVADSLDDALRFGVRDGDYFGRGQPLAPHLRGKIVMCDHAWEIR